MLRSTLETPRAGLHWDFRISRQIPPAALIFGWKIDAQAEEPPLEGGVGRPEDHGIPAEEVVAHRTCRAVLDRGRLDLGEFALESTKGHRTWREW
jgi:hypothetical protein